jgi:ABC-type spermidine/putrescine transport system permease subunit I
VGRKDESGGTWFPRAFWPSFAAPATTWVLLFFVLPFYVILCVAFGGLDQIFLTATPVYNPVRWDTTAFREVVSQLFTSQSITQQTFVRTLVYVGIATAICLLIGYPVAYFIARHSGRWKVAFLVAFIAPFWISYMMRMFAWVNLLQEDGYVNRFLEAIGVIDQPEQWLSGKASTVVFGLIYGYIPFMILPLFGSLDRINQSLLEAGRDLGASPAQTFRRVTLPLSKPAILAGLVIVSLPMFGDYYTNNLLSNSPKTSMYGNLIDAAVGQAGQGPEAGSLTLILIVLVMIPMLYYLRATRRAAEGIA